jgi:hypothetical protein
LDDTQQTPSKRTLSPPQKLFGEMPLAFFDTTSLFFNGAGGQTLGQEGRSKDEDDGVAVPPLIPHQKGATALGIEDISIRGRRDVPCRNEEEAKEAAEARVAIIAGLERKRAQGPTARVGNKRYRRLLAAPEDEHCTIGPAHVVEDERF